MNVGKDIFVELVHAQVEVLELWASKEIPVGDFVTVRVARSHRFEIVDDGDRFFGFLLRPLFLVLLNDEVALLDLVLVDFDLIG